MSKPTSSNKSIPRATSKVATANNTTLKIVAGATAVLCVGGVAAFSHISSQNKAAEQQQIVLAEAQATSFNNLVVRNDEKAQAIVTGGVRSTELAAMYQTNLEVVEEVKADEIKVEYDAAAAAEAAEKAAEAAAAAQEAYDIMYNTGNFDPSIYGYSGQDKVSYWYGINSDTVGYLYIPGTNISHAVVQNNQDVNYYTERGYYKEDSYYGVLWSNPGTSSSGTAAQMSDNTVIYGHNWSNISNNPSIGRSSDLMFAQLTGYHHTGMAKSFPYIYYSTSQEVMVFKIFACFYTGVNENPYYIQVNGYNSTIVADALSRSRHTFDVDVNGSDKLLTLSTCTRAYGSTANQRFVVMARLLRAGESITDEVNVTYNPNHKQPSVWS